MEKPACNMQEPGGGGARGKQRYPAPQAPKRTKRRLRRRENATNDTKMAKKSRTRSPLHECRSKPRCDPTPCSSTVNPREKRPRPRLVRVRFFKCYDAPRVRPASCPRPLQFLPELAAPAQAAGCNRMGCRKGPTRWLFCVASAQKPIQ
eukprot:gene19480-biopygen6987